jgi:hypothetical protein
MGVRFPTAYSNTFIGPLPASAAETVLLTTPPINEPIDNATVLLFWSACITAGTATTFWQFRLRRGTTTGGTAINVGVWQLNVTAAQAFNPSWWYFDNPGIVAGQQYSLTVVQSGATGAGTWNDGALVAMVL